MEWWVDIVVDGCVDRWESFVLPPHQQVAKQVANTATLRKGKMTKKSLIQCNSRVEHWMQIQKPAN